MTTTEIVEKQREYFLTGETQSVEFRKKQLKNLKEIILSNENKIYDALKSDLGKSEIESYMCEVAMVIHEIDFMIKNLNRFVKKQKTSVGVVNFKATAYSKPYPKGVVLIMSPWNYPFMLTITPLVDALAAGNTAIVKPSAYSPCTSKLIDELLSSTFESQYVSVVTGGRDVNQDLLKIKFDHIFFTGSKSVGHIVLENANKNFTPVTLELGGKSPCIVDNTAIIPLSAKRIVFGKFLNVGQTCIAPDYILVHESVKDLLIKAIVDEIKLQYGENPIDDPTYGKLISEKHMEKALSLLDGQDIIYGGKIDKERLKIEPTIVDVSDLDTLIMKEEIFAPILPIVTFKTKDEALCIIRRNDTPLAMYVFTKNNVFRDYFLDNVNYGGACVNDTILHITVQNLPFGGVGTSGLGAYHGRRGFDTFSNYRGIYDKSTKVDLSMRYRPYSEFTKKLIRKFF